jgi:hypothetical protein
MTKGLAAYFCRTVKDAGALANTHELLLYTLPFNTFWAFLGELMNAGEEGGIICATVISKERSQATWRLWTGLVMLAVGVCLVYLFGNVAGGISGPLSVAGLVLTIWGLVRSILATVSLMRCKTFARKLKH